MCPVSKNNIINVGIKNYLVFLSWMRWRLIGQTISLIPASIKVYSDLPFFLGSDLALFINWDISKIKGQIAPFCYATLSKRSVPPIKILTNVRKYPI